MIDFRYRNKKGFTAAAFYGTVLGLWFCSCALFPSVSYAVVDGAGNDVILYNVGIGSSTPRTKLDVAGGMQVSGVSTLTGGAVISADVTIGSSPAATYTTANADVFVKGHVEADGTLYGYAMMLSSGNTVNSIVTTISSPTNLQIPTAAAVSTYVAANSGGASITSGDTTVIVTDGGATGQVAFKINGSTSVIVDQNGNVGIGTSVPASRFAVMGAGTSTNKMIELYDSGKTSRFVVLDNGNVGVGVAAPTVALDVNGALNTSGAGDSSFVGNVGIGSTVPRSVLEVIGLGTTTNWALAVANSAKTVKFLVLDSGNVGVGSSVPRGKIDTDGTIYGYGMMLSSGNTVNAIVTSISSPTNLQIPTASAVSTYVATQVTTLASITSGDTTVIVTDGGATGQAAFKINGSTSMIVDQNGNLGVGSASPTTKLAVSGDVNLNGNIRIDTANNQVIIDLSN